MRCRNCGWDNQDENNKCEKCNAPLIGTSNPVTENSNTDSASMNAVPRENNSQKTSRHNSSVEEAKRTRREGEPEPLITKNTINVDREESAKVCPNCEYLVSSSSSNCPMCGNDLVHSHPQPKETPKSEIPKNTKNTATKKCKQCANQIPSNVRFCPECGHPVRQQTINPWATPARKPICTLTPVAWEDEQIEELPIEYSGEKITLNRDNTEPDNFNITSLEQAELSCEDGKWYIQDKSTQKTTFVYAGKKTMLETGDIVILGNRKFEFKA